MPLTEPMKRELLQKVAEAEHFKKLKANVLEELKNKANHSAVMTQLEERLRGDRAALDAAAVVSNLETIREGNEALFNNVTNGVL